MKPAPVRRLIQPNPSGRAGKPSHHVRKNRGVWWLFLIGAIGAVTVFLTRQKPDGPASRQEVVQIRMTEEQNLPPTAKVEENQPPATAPDPTPEAAPDQNAAAVLQPETVPQIAETRGSVSPGAVIGFADEAPLLLTGIGAKRDAAVKRDQELLDRAITTSEWNAYRKLLGSSIQAAIAKLPRGEGLNRFDLVWNEPVLYQTLLRWKTLASFPDSKLGELITDSYPADFLRWLLFRNETMEELLLTLHPADDAGSVLSFLIETRKDNPANFEKYFSLVLACAVVFENPVAIPHPIGSDGYALEREVDPIKRYQWYIDKNEKGKLAAPVHRQNARDLIWVVCAPVSTSELEWAISKINGSRQNWGQNYGKVKYLMDRAVNRTNPYEEYSFAEILKHGGICGDQTYFCVNTARAHGIPAMNLSGETNNGPHAWAGIKIDSREWTTGVGRVGGVSKGQAPHPQTGKRITEQEVLLWNDRQHQSPGITLNVWRHLWLADLFSATDQDENSAETVRLANRLGPSFTETWHALYALLERRMKLTGDPAKPNNLEEWKTFASDMRREFKDNPRMVELAAKAEMEYIFPYGETGDATRTLLRERRRVERESSEQADLIAGSLKREADLIHKLGGPNVKRDISRLYDRALRDYGGSITGFKIMAEDYFKFMSDDPESAAKAARDIELAFKRVVETGSKDWFRTTTEASICRMICSYYRTAGDNKRAELLEKRYEVLLRRAKRGAL